ncbi:hypothetical protein SNEBB_001202 [Seison nebaliae]|nr:hypothetical protein SNEBB_001202 [Seison nebaliae]
MEIERINQLTNELYIWKRLILSISILILIELILCFVISFYNYYHAYKNGVYHYEQYLKRQLICYIYLLCTSDEIVRTCYQQVVKAKESIHRAIHLVTYFLAHSYYENRKRFTKIKISCTCPKKHHRNKIVDRDGDNMCNTQNIQSSITEDCQNITNCLVLDNLSIRLKSSVTLLEMDQVLERIKDPSVFGTNNILEEYTSFHDI